MSENGVRALSYFFGLGGLAFNDFDPSGFRI